jgi:hypothetical protein
MNLVSIENEQQKIIEQSEIINYYTKQISRYKKHISQVKENIRTQRLIIAQVDILNASVENGLVNGSTIEMIQPTQNIADLVEDIMMYHQELKMYREYLHDYIIKKLNVINTQRIIETCKIEKEKHNVREVCNYKNIHCENIHHIICVYVG